MCQICHAVSEEPGKISVSLGMSVLKIEKNKSWTDNPMTNLFQMSYLQIPNSWFMGLLQFLSFAVLLQICPFTLSASKSPLRTQTLKRQEFATTCLESIFLWNNWFKLLQGMSLWKATCGSMSPFHQWSISLHSIWSSAHRSLLALLLYCTSWETSAHLCSEQ